MEFYYLHDLFSYSEIIDRNPIITIVNGAIPNHNPCLLSLEHKMITFKDCKIKQQIIINKSFTNDNYNINIDQHFDYIMFDCFNNCYFVNINHNNDYQQYNFNTSTDTCIKLKYILLIDNTYTFNNIVGENGLFYIYKNNKIIKNVKATDKFRLNNTTINIIQSMCHENTRFYPDKTILADISIDLVRGYITSHYDNKIDLKIKFE